MQFGRNAIFGFCGCLILTMLVQTIFLYKRRWNTQEVKRVNVDQLIKNFESSFSKDEALHYIRRGHVEEEEFIPRDIERIIKLYESSFGKENNVFVPKGGCQTEPIVTFIIPSLFRMSLADTLASLQNQTMCNWKAIIVYQGSSALGMPSLAGKLMPEPPEYYQILPLHQMADSRITFLESAAHAEVNFAGNIRNAAMLHADTEWIAFVDDDDTLLPHYIESLQHEAALTPDASVVLFRMLCKTCYTVVIPPRNHLNLLRSYTGISFAVKRGLIAPHGDYTFPTGANEDYCFLYNIRNGGHKLVMSPRITYLVKGHNPQYLPELAASQGGVDTGIERSAFSVRPGSYPTECIQKHLLSYATLPSDKTHLGFTFPESGHYIFQQNIDGLKLALTRAAEAGCLSKWLLEKANIEIHFSYLTPVTKGRPFIQVQVEQIHSRRHMFTAAYIHKLRTALQVWTIAPTHFKFMQSYLRVRQSYFIPLWLMVDPLATKERSCRNQSVVSKYLVTKRVRDDTPYADDTKDSLLTECQILPLGEQKKEEERKKKKKREKEAAGRPNCDMPRAVMFGALLGSDNDRRLKLCTGLKRALSSQGGSPEEDGSGGSGGGGGGGNTSSFECFHGIYGPALDRVLCKADIVVVDRFYSNGAIESHRIDPLLKMGKIIVSSPSRDLQMQRLYKSVVIFTRSFDDMVATLQRLLSNPSLRDSMKRKGQEFMRQRSQDIRPLCRAISDVQKLLVEHSTIIPSLEYVETADEKALRKIKDSIPKKLRKIRPIPPSPPILPFSQLIE